MFFRHDYYFIEKELHGRRLKLILWCKEIVSRVYELFILLLDVCYSDSL